MRMSTTYIKIVFEEIHTLIKNEVIEELLGMYLHVSTTIPTVLTSGGWAFSCIAAINEVLPRS